MKVLDYHAYETLNWKQSRKEAKQKSLREKKRQNRKG